MQTNTKHPVEGKHEWVDAAVLRHHLAKHKNFCEKLQKDAAQGAMRTDYGRGMVAGRIAEIKALKAVVSLDHTPPCRLVISDLKCTYCDNDAAHVVQNPTFANGRNVIVCPKCLDEITAKNPDLKVFTPSYEPQERVRVLGPWTKDELADDLFGKIERGESSDGWPATEDEQDSEA